jgi:hypothetical protein
MAGETDEEGNGGKHLGKTLFLRGFVRLGDQNYSLGCVVRDVSETDARSAFAELEDYRR